ncbi:MAG: rRNA maturation RNase YbeY, partial [Planctomycetota bacterium]
TVHPHLNLPHQVGGIQSDNEYSPPMVGGGSLLQERTKKTAGKKVALRGNTLTGEIIISVEMAKKLAQKHDCTVEGEIALYLVHGLLHLFGYNDKQKKEAKKMHHREGELLSDLGFRVPVPH